MDPHRIGRRPPQQGSLRLLPSFVGSLVATATPDNTRHLVSSGLSVASSPEIITGNPATPRTFTLNLPFKKQIGRYPDPYLSTLAPLSSAPLPKQPPPQQIPKQPNPPNPHTTNHNKPVNSAADYSYYDDDDEYYYDDSQQDQLSPPQILQIVNSVQSALATPKRRTRLPFSSSSSRTPPSNSFQIPRQPKQQQQQQTFLTSNSLNRFSGRQVAVKGFPNGLPDATPEGVVIALLNAKNSKLKQ